MVHSVVVGVHTKRLQMALKSRKQRKIAVIEGRNIVAEKKRKTAVLFKNS
jgi:hypothetical protein